MEAQATAIVVAVIFSLLSTISILVRIRYQQKRRLRAADHAILASGVLNLGFLIASITTVAFTQQPASYDKQAASRYAYEVISTLLQGVICLAILFFFLGLATTYVHRKSIQCVVAFVILTTSLQSVLLLISCQTLSDDLVWSQAQSCVDEYTSVLITGIPQVVLQLATFLLGLPIIWNRQPSKTQGIATAVGFVLSTFVIAASITSMFFAYIANTTPGYIISSITWRSIELNSFLIMGNLIPTWDYILHHVFTAATPLLSSRTRRRLRSGSIFSEHAGQFPWPSRNADYNDRMRSPDFSIIDVQTIRMKAGDKPINFDEYEFSPRPTTSAKFVVEQDMKKEPDGITAQVQTFGVTTLVRDDLPDPPVILFGEPCLPRPAYTSDRRLQSPAPRLTLEEVLAESRVPRAL